MPALDAGIHVAPPNPLSDMFFGGTAWIAESSPAMTQKGDVGLPKTKPDKTRPDTPSYSFRRAAMLS